MKNPIRPLLVVRDRHSAFTLLEILVVLAIIGLLAGLAIVNVDRIWERTRISAAELFVRQTMKTALVSYKYSMSDFPSTAESLQALVAAPADKASKWRGPYLDGKLPRDPWGEPYQYVYPGKHVKDGYDLWSKGPDKQDGTLDDIGNWQAESSESAK